MLLLLLLLEGCATLAAASSISGSSITTNGGSSSSSRGSQVQGVPLCGLVLTQGRLHTQLLEEGLVLQNLLLHVLKHTQRQQVRLLLLLLLQGFLQLR
jgi:hypothetical protein